MKIIIIPSLALNLIELKEESLLILIKNGIKK